MEEINDTFSEYLNEFKKLKNKDKKIKIIKSISEIIYVFDNLAKLDNIDFHYLKKFDEVKLLNKDNMSDEEFLELELIYIETAKNIIGEYLEYKL